MTLSRHNIGSQRKGEFQLAKTMMVMVIVFLFTNFTRIILGVQELLLYPTVNWCYNKDFDYHPSVYTYILDFIARFLVILNSSINFLIYCMVGSKFRTKLLEMLKVKQTSSERFQNSEVSRFSQR